MGTVDRDEPSAELELSEISDHGDSIESTDSQKNPADESKEDPVLMAIAEDLKQQEELEAEVNDGLVTMNDAVFRAPTE